MGSDKAWLPWGEGTLLGHVAERLAAGVDGPLIVVARAGQELPSLPPGAARVDDAVADEGPLRGLAGGLAAAAARGAEVAVAVTVDAPFLAPAVVAALARALGSDPGSEAAALCAGGRLLRFPPPTAARSRPAPSACWQTASAAHGRFWRPRACGASSPRSCWRTPRSPRRIRGCGRSRTSTTRAPTSA